MSSFSTLWTLLLHLRNVSIISSGNLSSQLIPRDHEDCMLSFKGSVIGASQPSGSKILEMSESRNRFVKFFFRSWVNLKTKISFVGSGLIPSASTEKSFAENPCSFSRRSLGKDSMTSAELLANFRRGNCLVANWHLTSLISFFAEDMSSAPVIDVEVSIDCFSDTWMLACFYEWSYRVIATASNPMCHSCHPVGFHRLVVGISPEVLVIILILLVKNNLTIHLCNVSGWFQWGSVGTLADDQTNRFEAWGQPSVHRSVKFGYSFGH